MTSFVRIAALLLALIVQCDGLVLGTRSASLAPRTSLVRLEAPPPPPKGKLGATIDQDGKSNVWVSPHAGPTNKTLSVLLVTAF